MDAVLPGAMEEQEWKAVAHTIQRPQFCSPKDIDVFFIHIHGFVKPVVHSLNTL